MTTLALDVPCHQSSGDPPPAHPTPTVKCSHDKNVRSLANATLGSTRTGSAIRFAAVRWRRGCVDMIVVKRKGLLRVFVEDGTRNNEHGMGLSCRS